ncbi:hypothetical protein [Rhodovibrio sodomensis]|uniref:hypothetical protein n=1 Tax=Rhodovibrio sodomensis TaxID=1088 RepID=UPI0019035B4F|nr:hypothetical protein [Rhodovibrio sodomensis]
MDITSLFDLSTLSAADAGGLMAAAGVVLMVIKRLIVGLLVKVAGLMLFLSPVLASLS